MLRPGKSARRRRGGELRRLPAADQNSAQGHQRRLASVRAELLPPLPPGRAPCGGGGYVHEPSRVSVCDQNRERSMPNGDNGDKLKNSALNRRNILLGGSAALAVTAAIPGLSPVNAATPRWPDIRAAKDIAEAGFIYGLPIVMNYAVMNEYAVNKNSGQYKAPFNQIKNEARVFTYEDTAVITPNSDTPYSFAWMDLRAEPIVLTVPAVEKPRYYSVMLEDGNTFVYGYIGSRATGFEAGDYVVSGPDWNGATPSAIKKVFQSTTQFSLVGYRTQLFKPADMDNVKKIQAGYKV